MYPLITRAFLIHVYALLDPTPPAFPLLVFIMRQFGILWLLTFGSQVLQWWWLGTAAKQTYESCVDFKIAPAVQKRAFRA